MTTVSLASLIIQEGKTAIYNAALAVAAAIGVPVSTWQAGDPTRSLYHVESEKLAALEEIVVGFIKSRFLDLATGVWLKVKAEQDYGVTVPEATYATATVVLTNPGGGFYPDIEAGDLTVKNSTTDKTYTNTTAGTLASGPGTTLSITVVADEPGSDSSAAIGEIDELVTKLGAVTCTNTTAAVGLDEQDAAITRQTCRDRLGRLSPNGPKDAYTDVARDPELTGTSAITDARAYGDSDSGDVTVYLRGPGGAVDSADVDLVEEAVLAWATPLCITPTVLSCTAVSVPVTYTLWIYKSCNKTVAEIEEAVEEQLEQMFAERPIGGDIVPPATTGSLYKSLIESTIRETFPETVFRVTVAAPAGDTALTNGQVAAIGAVTATINIIPDPT